jgi:hypothetical protein
MGAGTGAPSYQLTAARLVRAGLVTLGEVHLTDSDIASAERHRRAFKSAMGAQARAAGATYAARAWSTGNAWLPVSIRHGARGGFDMAPPVIAWDRSRHDRASNGYARALVSGRHITLWARALAAHPYKGAGDEIAARRGGWLAGFEAARAARLLAGADDMAAARKRRAVDRDKLPVSNGTAEARARRAARVASSAVAAPPCADLIAPLRSVDWSREAHLTECCFLRRGMFGPWDEARAAMRARHAQARAMAPGAFALWSLVATVAEARGRKWARGTHSSAKGAASRHEIGAAAAADDMGDFWERLTGEAVAIFRWAAFGRVSLLVSHLQARGVRVNRSARRALATLPGSWADGRAAAEAWEYAACKGRDGREVAGGWAMQGAVHGLRDFAFSAPVEWAPDDMGAAEWSALVDAAAARVGLAPSGEAARAAELVRDGYSPRLAQALAADESRGESDSGAAADAACVDLGALAWAPDAGAGSGVRPSVRAALAGMAEAVQAATVARSRAANAGAAARASGAAARAADLVGGLLSWMDGGRGPDADAVAEFFAADGTLTATGRKRLQRLRERYGYSLGHGPARAVEPRAASRAPSAAGDELATL